MRLILLTICLTATAQDRRVFWLDTLMVVVSPVGRMESEIIACAYNSREGDEAPIIAVHHGDDAAYIVHVAESSDGCWSSGVLPMPSNEVKEVREVSAISRPKRSGQ